MEILGGIFSLPGATRRRSVGIGRVVLKFLVAILEVRWAILGALRGQFWEVLDGILSLVNADDSEEMEASIVSSGAKTLIQQAVEDFGSHNPQLTRNGNELVRILEAYEASMNAYRKN